jgi:putative membrane protein
MGWGFGPMWFGPLLWLVIAVLVVWLVVRLLNRSAASPSASRTPLEILEERFARGEIDEKEFEDRKRVLKR